MVAILEKKCDIILEVMTHSDELLIMFVGDVGESTSMLAKSYDPMAQLVDHNNYRQLLHTRPTEKTTLYTSLGDLPKDMTIVYNIFSLADRIVYCPQKYWSDKKQIEIIDPTTSLQGLTESLLLLVSEHVTVDNLCPGIKDPDPLVDYRKTNQAQMWVAGCSISHGVGVDPAQTYGQLTANELNLECSTLTKPGSSIDWAADQILRSDIKKNDLVIWGLTHCGRLSYIHNDALFTVTGRSYEIDAGLEKIIPMSNLYSQNNIYKQVYSIEKVINFCSKCQATLILFGVVSDLWLLPFLKTQTNYWRFPYPIHAIFDCLTSNFIDLGNDGQHPGPMQHNEYKTFLINKIRQNHSALDKIKL